MQSVNHAPNKKRPVVLCPTRFYLPCFKAGGVPRVIANVIEELGDDYEFRVITSDRDLNSDVPYPELNGSGRWEKVGKAHVMYLTPSEITIANMFALMRTVEPDMLFLNGFFEPWFIQLPALYYRWIAKGEKIPVLIGPRGEFHEGAFGLKRWKKSPCAWAHRLFGTYEGADWLASNLQEETDIRRIMGDVRAHVCADMPTAISEPLPANWNKKTGALRAIFYSRISPKKNLPYALEVLSGITMEPGSVELHICGPWESDAYRTYCQGLIDRLPKSIAVKYVGVVEQEKVINLLAGYDLMFLPTMGENFGFVILEALRSGCPVLISDQTPWVGLNESGCGWGLPLSSKEAFRQAIHEAILWDDAERKTKGVLAQEYAEKTLQKMNSKSEWHELFRAMINKRIPSSVSEVSPAARANK